MKLSCHCGSVEAEINSTVSDLAKIVRCNCSICKRKNATMGMVKNEDFKITKGEDKLKLYQYHTKVAKHYFCNECGIYTHHRSYTKPENFEFNVACIEDIDTFKLNEVPVYDGIKL